MSIKSTCPTKSSTIGSGPPKTSQPPAGAFVEAYEELEAYDDILVLTLSSELSGTYDSAVAAAEIVDRHVEVRDMRSAEMGSGLIFVEALNTADGGGSFEDVLQAAERAIKGCEVLFAVGTLEYLAKSGRIGRAQRLVGTALNIRPVLRLEDGLVVPHKRARGRNRQMAVVAEQIKPAIESGKKLYYGHVAAPELLEEFCDMLGVDDPAVTGIGGVVGAHVGPGAYGVAYL
jgi:DegV family protein with EDD domain